MSEVKLHDKRPLSPHLSIYRPIPTMIISIVHRVTGMALYGGTLLLAWWLYGVASGEATFNTTNGVISHPLGQLVLFGFTWALIHHMLGGIRHFFWDLGKGFEKETATKTAWLILILSILITLAIWVIGYAR